MYGTSLLRINYTGGANQILRHIPLWTARCKMQGDTSAKLILGNIQLLSEIWLKYIHCTGPKTGGSKCHLGDPNNATDIWGYFWVSKRQIWNHVSPLCADFPQKKINNQRMPKIRNTRQSSGGVLSLQKVWRCFDVREVSKVWWGGLLKLGHKGSHFVKSLSEKHCKKHEAHFLSRKKNSSPVLGRNRLSPLIWWDSLNILEKLMHNECPQIRNKLVSLKTTSEVD